MRRPITGWRVAAFFAFTSLVPMGFIPSGVPVFAEETSKMEAKQDAKLLFNEALRLKKAGKFQEAAENFEKALRKDRAILGEDDDGLIKILRDMYSKRLAAAPEDVAVLEAMGFISAVCESDFPKAIEYYTKVEALSKIPQVKSRTTSLIERLKAQIEAGTGYQTEYSGKAREERLKSWSEMEKQEALAAQSEAAAQREAKLAEMYRSREEKDARIPQIEDELKALDEEIARNHRMYLNSNDRWYKRKQDTGEREFAAKKDEAAKLKQDLDKLNAEIDKMSKEDPNKQGASAASSGNGGQGEAVEPGTENGTNTTGNPDSSAASGTGTDVSGGANPPDATNGGSGATGAVTDSSAGGTSGGNGDTDSGSGTSSGTTTSTETSSGASTATSSEIDPALPPVDSPDFPKDMGPVDTGSAKPASNTTGVTSSSTGSSSSTP
ncbi:MAG: hypothetical protein WA705_17210 [Candidatus Ozemobacteraceae bacterium]